jgi:hypothetical protein
MIKEECKKASQILCKLFDGHIAMFATIVTAEANNDYATLRSMLLHVQGEIGRVVVALKEIEDREALEVENAEFDCGHDVKHNSEEL